jgi:hypothetical protein
MFTANFVKCLFRRARASVRYVIKSLTDAFLGIGAGSNVEQPLIGFGVLHDCRCLPLHGEHYGALAAFMKSPDRRRNVVSDWMSVVMSIMIPLLFGAPF